METFALHAATSDDDEFLRELYFDVRREEFAVAGLPEAQIAMILDMQFRARRESYSRENPDMTSRIIKVDSLPVGSILTKINPEGMHLIDISLLGAMRGKGIGAAVVNRLKTESDRITLNVFVGNENARRLYERLGFIAVGGDSAYIFMEWKND